MSGTPFGWGALGAVLLYLLVVVGLGYVARRARLDETLGEFYLAGRSLGGFVLLLTLYATQYSGNTLLGYPGEAYRLGFAWIMSVGFMMAIVVVYLLFAPRLHHLGRRNGYVTPGDWIQDRFGSTALTLGANVLLVVAIANYLLAQLMAMGHVVAGFSGGAIPYWLGVLFLTLIIIVYETLGGMRAVAWTDCIQGLMLLVGLVGLLLVAAPSSEHLRAATEWILAQQPEKVAVPSWEVCATWASTVLLIGLSGAVYPQAIQRIYAARSVNVLRRSLMLMIFMPLVTITTVFLIGIFGIRQLSGLGTIRADQVMPLLLNEWAAQSALMYALALLVVVGVIAAIMSTADSVLLSLSSILAKDFLGRSFLRDAPEERITRWGKILSWAVVGVLVSIALVPRMTLWGLTELKMEILCQVSPVFLLGLTWRRLTARAALSGILAGSALAASLFLGGYEKIGGIHAGMLGWCLNVVVAVGVSLASVRVPEGSLARA